MLHEGRLDLQGGGLLASLNYLGYFVGALSCAAIRLRPSAMVRGGLLATAALLLGMGLLHGFTAWGVLRTAAGVVSAWTFVFASGWGSAPPGRNPGAGAGRRHFHRARASASRRPACMGGAIGRWGSDAGWIGFGLLALVLIALIWRLFDDGDAPCGGGVSASAARAARYRRRPPRVAQRCALAGRAVRAGRLRLHHHRHLPAGDRAPGAAGSTWPDLFWPLFGLAVIPGALIGARAPTHWDNRLLLAVGLCAAGAGRGCCRSSWPTVGGFALGSLLLGLPFTAITLFAVREARRLRGNAAAGLIGYATASLRRRADPRPALRGAAGAAHRLVRRAAAGGGRRAGPRRGAVRLGLVALAPNGAMDSCICHTSLAYNPRLTTKRAGTNRPFFIGRSISRMRRRRRTARIGAASVSQGTYRTRGIAADSGTNRGRTRLRPGRDRTLGRRPAARHDRSALDGPSSKACATASRSSTSRTARRSRASCSSRWKSKAPNTSGWRCPRRASTGRCAASRISSVLPAR